MPKEKGVDVRPLESLESISRRLAPEGTIDRETLEGEAMGGLNAEAVRQNKMMLSVEQQKRAGTARVSWGETDACPLYETMLRLYPASTMSIYVQRLGDKDYSWYIRGEPRSGTELYDMVKSQCHGQMAACQYKLQFKDKQSSFWRGIGRLNMPDGAPEPSPARPAPPPWEAWPGQPPTQTWPAAAPAPAAAPQPPHGGGDALTGQLFSMLQSLQQQVVALASRPPPGAAMPPPLPPPPGLAAPPPAAAPAAPAPAVVPPQGATVWVNGYGWMTATKPPDPPPAPTAAKPASLLDSYRDAMGQVTEITRMAKEARRLVEPSPALPVVEDPPFVQTKVGDVNLVQNPDGSLRLVETAIANADKFMGWMAQQREITARALAAGAAPPAPPAATSTPAAAPTANGMPTSAASLSPPSLPTRP
jgi:hypothetical protein